MKYVPSPPPQNQDGVVRYLYNELGKLAVLLEGSSILPETHVAPDKQTNGLLAYADGTNWNPGSGRGLYQYRTGTGWVFIG